MNYPLITWQVYAPGFTNSLAAPFTGGTAFGYGFSNTNVPPVDTLAYIIYDALLTAGAQYIVAEYNVVNTTGPSLGPATITFSYFANVPMTLTFFSLADAAVYGFDTLSVLFPGAGNTYLVTTVFNADGIWAPSGVSGDVRRTTRQRAASSSSEMSGLSTDVVNWGEVADIEVRSTLFPVANAFTWYASQSIYATKAQRNVNDPNNICEKMLAAAATGVTFRVYEQKATAAGFTSANYLVAKMPGISSKSAATAFLQADDEPRLFSASGMFFRGTT